MAVVFAHTVLGIEIDIARFVFLNGTDAVADQPMFCREAQDMFAVISICSLGHGAEPIVVVFILVNKHGLVADGRDGVAKGKIWAFCVGRVVRGSFGLRCLASQ